MTHVNVGIYWSSQYRSTAIRRSTDYSALQSREFVATTTELINCLTAHCVKTWLYRDDDNQLQKDGVEIPRDDPLDPDKTLPVCHVTNVPKLHIYVLLNFVSIWILNCTEQTHKGCLQILYMNLYFADSSALAAWSFVRIDLIRFLS